MATSKKSPSLPKTITILGQKWKVRIESDPGFHGRCHKKERVITINANDTPAEQLDTLMHESLHALFYESKLDRVTSMEMEEMIVWNVTEFIMETFIGVKV